MSAFDQLWDNKFFAGVFGVSCIYVHDTSPTPTSIALEGVLDQKLTALQQAEFGAETVTETKEWLIRIEDLLQDPQKGDTIIDNAGRTWEVVPIGTSPRFEYDQDTKYYRVRSVLVSEGS